MTIARERPHFDEVPPQLGAMLRPFLPDLAERITEQIQGEVKAYAGPREGRRRAVIRQAVGAALEHYAELASGRDRSGREVDEMFRRMGRGEAAEGHNLAHMKAAYDIATRDAWDALHRFAVANGLSTTLLGTLGDSLFAYMDHLNDQVALGYMAFHSEVSRVAQRWRNQLFAAVVNGAPESDVRDLANDAQWPLPAEVVLLAADVTTHPQPPPGMFGPEVLYGRRLGRAVLVCPADDHHTTLSATENLFTTPVVVGVPVPVAEAPEALRWNLRLLDLVDSGVVPPAPRIRCADHVSTLWLQAEPLLRRELCRRELTPLLLETAHTRAVLSETLLAWLETHESAPALAARLGVHPQTVRYRLKRLRAMFGERLDDPAGTVPLMLALQASLPLWTAGHVQADLDAITPPRG